MNIQWKLIPYILTDNSKINNEINVIKFTFGPVYSQIFKHDLYIWNGSKV